MVEVSSAQGLATSGGGVELRRRKGDKKGKKMKEAQLTRPKGLAQGSQGLGPGSWPTGRLGISREPEEVGEWKHLRPLTSAILNLTLVIPKVPNIGFNIIPGSFCISMVCMEIRI